MNPIPDRSTQTPADERRSNYNTGMFFAIVVLCGVLLARGLPADIETRLPAIGAFARLMAAVVPSIDHFVAISQFPQVTRTFLAFAWASVPILLYAAFRVPGLLMLNRAYIARGPIRIVLGLTVVSLLIIFGATCFPAVDPANLNGSAFVYRALRAVSQSRFWLGAIGAAVCWGVAIACALLIVTSQIVRELVTARKIEKQKGIRP